MKLSTVFELLLIFLIISFAASKFIGHKDGAKWKTLLEKSLHKEFRKERQATPNRYCLCSNLTCNCCRDFSLPVVPVISGPGCASLKYLQGDSMLVTMSFGERILRNVTISGKKPKPICMNLPGGISKFCGRIYGISRDGEDLSACLGLELRSQDDVEASLRVSCFKLGPKGLNVEPGKPVPSDEDNDDDDEDDFGFPGDDDEDDDDEDDDDDDDDDDDVFGLGEDEDNEAENAVESAEGDYTGLSALGDEFLETFFESDSKDKKKKPTSSATTATKPQQIATIKPYLVSTVIPSKRIKPQNVMNHKPTVVVSTPSKVVATFSVTAANPVTTAATTEQVQHFSIHSSAPNTNGGAASIDTINSPSSAEKVYVSPLQYKPTEKIRPSANQPLESYIPTMAQLPVAEKVYTSPQQISTDKVYVSTLNLITENYVSTIDEDKESPTLTNFYMPTTQQFQSTERIYLPSNLSASGPSEDEPVTSTSMTVNVVQSVDESQAQNNTVEKLEKPTALPVFETSATEVTPNNENNEVDADAKPAIIDNRLNEVNIVQSSIPIKVNKVVPTPPTRIFAPAIATATKAPVRKNQPTITSSSTSTESVKTEEDDEDEFSDMVDTAASVFGTDEEGGIKQNNHTDTSDESVDLEDGLEDSDEDSEEGSIALTSNNDASNSDYGGEEETEDDSVVSSSIDDEDADTDDEFRKFDVHTKQTIAVNPNTQSSSKSQTTAAIHNGRQHKRMNLPPLFSQQSPEISSYWSSGGHVYKIRMSSLIQEPSSLLQNANRLGRLNLFVPALKSNFLNNSFVTKSSISTTQPSTTTTLASGMSFNPEKLTIPHRFSLTDSRNQTAFNNRSDRNHKRMRMPRAELER